MSDRLGSERFTAYADGHTHQVVENAVLGVEGRQKLRADSKIVSEGLHAFVANGYNADAPEVQHAFAKLHGHPKMTLEGVLSVEDAKLQEHRKTIVRAFEQYQREHPLTTAAAPTPPGM